MDYREQATTLEGVSMMEVGSGTVNGFGEPQQIPGMRVSTNFFPLLGIRMHLGRDFQNGEGWKDRVGIISHNAWQKWFGGDPRAVGRRVLLDGMSYTIIGVLPPGVSLPLPSEMFAPWSDADLRGRNRMEHSLGVLAKLKPGVTWAQASSELDAIQRRIAETTPRMKDWSAYIVSFQGWMSQRTRPALLLLLSAVGLVLLIACTNLANLMLARASGRERDIAVRVALGAGRWTLIRQFLTESILLGILGGIAGLMLAYWGVDALDRIVPTRLRMPDTNADFIRPALSVDSTVLLFTAGVALLSGILFGLAPALASARARLNNILRQGTRGTSSGRSRALRDGLVVAEVALALLRLVGAGLTMESFWKIQAVPPGFASDHLLAIETELPTDSKYQTAKEMSVFHERVLANMAELPGVTAVGMSCALPMDEGEHRTDFLIEGKPLPPSGQLLSANLRSVSEGYFAALRIPLKRGRTLEASDTAERPKVAVIDTTTAQRYFTDGLDPIGQKIRVGRTNVVEVVGVVGEVRDSGLDKDAEPTIYLPYRQFPEPQVRYVIRHPNPASMIRAAKGAVYAVDKSQPVYNIRLMNDIVAGSQSGSRLMLSLIALFAAVALVLASLGIYGVVSYSVSQRRNEIGIRIALGAGAGEVMRMVIGQGLKLTIVGLVIGVAAAAAVSKLMATFLFGVRPLDPIVLGATALVLTAVAVAATYFPARRASRSNPLACLRYE
jgi:putative ABC transport system permease protein